MLTSTQREAVEEISKPLCVKAGPGTGKTMLLVEKIAHLIEKKNILPIQILTLTFTQKAAKELSERVEKRTGNIFMTYTFHSFALSILQTISREPESIVVLKDVDSIHFLVQKIKEYGYDEELKKDALFLAKEFYKTINSLKDQGISKQNLALVEFNQMHMRQHFIQLYTDYEKYKRKKNVCDFHDLEQKLYTYIMKKDEIAQKIAKIYPYIIVDEFQDTSPLQCKILEKLAQFNKHITVVGDEKQSIYGFRGTHTNSFETFQETFSNSKTLFLKEQFRSSLQVIKANNLLISQMVNEEEQLLLPQNSNKGEISKIVCRDEQEQYQHIVSKIQEFIEHNTSSTNKKTLGVVARTHSQLKELVLYAQQFGVEISYGQEDIFHTPSIEKLLNYLHIISNPKQSEKYIFSVFEQLEIPQFIPQFILHQARMFETDIYTFLKRYGANPKSKPFSEIYEQYEKDVEFICFKIEKLLSYIQEFESHRKIRKIMLQIMQDEEIYEKALTRNDAKLISNYNSLLQFISEYEKLSNSSNITDFLSYIQTAKDLHHNIVDSKISLNITNAQNLISAMTVHQAKGKEFDEVCILQCTNKYFPLPFRDEFLKHSYSITKEQSNEEELRLFFVAISRAKERVELLVPEFNSKGTPLQESPYLELIKSVTTKSIPKQHDLTRQTNVSKELLTKMIFALQRDDFSYAKKILKEFELIATSSKDLRHYEEEYVNKNNQIFQRKEEDGSYKKRVFSVSQIKTYQQCPKKYYYSYICRIPSEPKHFFSFGTSVHQVFELLMPMFDKELPKEEIMLYALHLLSMHWRSLGYESVNQEKEYFKKGLQAVEDFVEKELERRKNLGILHQGLEEEFRIKLGSEEFEMLGYIDRVDKDKNGNIHIIDYKTSKSMAYNSQLQEDLQLYTYALAYKQLKGEYPKTMALWYVIHNRIAQVEFKEDVVHKVQQKLIEGIQAINSNNFEASPSYFNCTYCDFKDICKDSLK
ncbi:MAG: ATP-dependent helicase [Nanoarchaeota archaeon]|nr:ATP-dependent helicase [Nanoarchaeota archaeon]